MRELEAGSISTGVDSLPSSFHWWASACYISLPPILEVYLGKTVSEDWTMLAPYWSLLGFVWLSLALSTLQYAMLADL